MLGVVENKFEEAALKYSASLEHNPFDATVYCNRECSQGVVCCE